MMTTAKKPPIWSEKRPNSLFFQKNSLIPCRWGVLPEKTAGTPSKQRVKAPSVEHIEAKIAHMASKPGLRSKINANCLYCTYDPLDTGGWRQQVEACNITKCPLHSVRPRSYGKK